MSAELDHVETRTVYTITDVPDLRDGRRSPFVPEQVIIVHRSDRGVWWVGVKGSKVSNGHRTETGFSVDKNGFLEPHYRNGPAPHWLIELLAAATAPHPSEVPGA